MFRNASRLTMLTGIATVAAVLIGGAIAATPAAAASPDVAAAQQSKQSGKPVVIDALTTPTSQVTALPDGTMQLVVNTLPVRAKVNGTWTPIDLTLKSDGGMLAPAISAMPVRFSAGGDTKLAAIATASGDWIDETWPYGALPAPRLDGATATYPEVLPGVDLRVEATASGMTEVFVIKSATALADPRVRQLTIGTTAHGLQTQASGLSASAADGSIARSSTPDWWDSSTAGSGPTGPGGVGLPSAVAHDVVGDQIRMNLGGLPQSIQFPLYIDPDWSGGVNAFWYIDQAYPTGSYLNGNQATGVQRMGWVDAAHSADSRNHLARAFWQMNVAGVAYKQILAAQFAVSLNGAFNCSTTTQQAAQLWTVTGAVNPGATWNQTGNVYGSAISSAWPSCGQTVGFDATSAVASAAGSGAGAVNLALRAASESNNVGWKKWNFGASLTVTYNTAPNAVTSPTYTSPVRSCSTDPAHPTVLDGAQPIVLQANAGDPDGQGVTTYFQVVSSSTGTVSTFTAPQPSGAVSATIPANALLTGDYRWAAISSDGYLYGGYSPNCYFRIALGHPALPTISLGTGQATVGQPIPITFNSNPADGVVLYAYWWVDNTDPVTIPAILSAVNSAQTLPACGTASGAIQFACPAAGATSATVSVAPIDESATLWVASYSPAGAISFDGGVAAAQHQTVTAAADVDGVSMSAGHIWDAEFLDPAADTVIPDQTTGTTPIDLPAGTLAAGEAWGGPATVQRFDGTTPPVVTSMSPIDSSQSFTVSALLTPASASAGAPRVAVSQTAQPSPRTAFTLGIDATGHAQFCMYTAYDASSACAVGPVLAAGVGTQVTGVWDKISQQLRVMVGNDLAGAAVTSYTSTSQVLATGDLCVGAHCSLDANNHLVTADSWIGDVLRPAVFPGVVSTPQLSNLVWGSNPNDAPPTDATIGTPMTGDYLTLITLQQAYDFNPSWALLPWTPSPGSDAGHAAAWGGLTAQLQSTGPGGWTIGISVADIADAATFHQLEANASAGTPVPGLGDAAYFSGGGSGVGVLQIFRGTKWFEFSGNATYGPADFDPLPADVLANIQ